MSLATIPIQPSILTWARESLGLSRAEVAGKMRRDVGDIEAWEQGTQQPTYAQLERLAEKVFKRPVAVFFLPAPPSSDPLEETFRTIGSQYLSEISSETRLHLRRAKALQLSLYELYGQRNSNRILLDFVLTPAHSVEQAVVDLREKLDLTFAEQLKWKNKRIAFNDLRDRIERSGISIFQFPLKDIRGFALEDDQYPIIGLSSKDEVSGRIFTLLHELAHLLLGQSDVMLDSSVAHSHREIERFCNQLAAEFLVPTEDLLQQLSEIEASEIDEPTIKRLATRYRISRIVIVRKLLDAGLVDQAFYVAKQALYRSQYQASTSNGGGPSPATSSRIFENED